MKFNAQATDITQDNTGCAIIAVDSNRQFTTSGTQLDQMSDGYLTEQINSGDCLGKLGQTLLLRNVPNCPASRVLIVGLGDSEALNEYKYVKAVRSAFSALKNTGASDATSYLSEITVPGRGDITWAVQQIVLLADEAGYQFDQMKSEKSPAPSLTELTISVSANPQAEAAELAVSQAEAIAVGMRATKDLANYPANVCTPTFIAEQCKQLAKSHKALTVDVLDEAKMEKMGMHTLLSVSKGSDEPAKLITLNYQGASKKEKPVALVGKGVTFDTGGISIKPAGAMDEMKFDMCGAATVVGVFAALTKLNLPINVIGVIPTTENMPGGKATKPGDIVTSLSGQTVEILNTDAEGRLILADALTYCEQFQPDCVIDIATLTGAMVVALGHDVTGMMTNQQSLADELLKASHDSSDHTWQLPLWEGYQENMSSNFADIANISNIRGAGSITAACFLSRFTKDYTWAHLDIAGTAYKSGKAKGASGRPVPLLTQFLINRAS